MVRPQIRRAAAAFVLTATLSLIPLGSAQAAVRPGGERHLTPSWLQGLVIQLLEKMGVKIDPNGLTTSADPNGPQ